MIIYNDIVMGTWTKADLQMTIWLLGPFLSLAGSLWGFIFGAQVEEEENRYMKIEV
jgi:hypothetical protein